MLLSLYFVALIITVVNSSTDITDEFVNIKGNYDRLNSGMKVILRRRRSLVSAGFRALKALLHETREVPTGSRNYRIFFKTGGAERAVEDFGSIGASGVFHRNFKNGMHLMQGKIGDRTFIYTSQSETGQPAIEIIQVKMLGDDAVTSLKRIFYED